MAEKTLDLQNTLTLVRYNNPTLVIKHEDKKGDKEVTGFLQGVEDFSRFFLRKFPRVPKMGDLLQVSLETRVKRLKRF